MADANAARRYARAVSQVAVDNRAEATVLADLQRFIAAISGEGKELDRALCSPLFVTAERLAVLDVVVPRLALSEITRRFLRILAERGRMGEIREILRLFEADMDERAGRVRVRVSTTEPLTPQLEAIIRDTFQKSTGKTVVLEADIDPSLIGGMVARVGDRVYDASLRTRLEDLRRRLINAPVAPEA